MQIESEKKKKKKGCWPNNLNENRGAVAVVVCGIKKSKNTVVEISKHRFFAFLQRNIGYRY